MRSAGRATQDKVVFLFTTFPVASETFLQREVIACQRAGLNFRLVSLWGGRHSWEGIPVEKGGLVTALCGILWIPYYLFKKPAIFWRFLKAVWCPRTSGLLNWGENLLGAGYALCTARRWILTGATHFHGVWASAPGMAAWFLSELTGLPFSFSGHAYDLYEQGGDGWLAGKMDAAAWIRTSSNVGRSRFVELGADPEKVILVRRGLVDMPPPLTSKEILPPYRILSVGRMVEKMGFDRQIQILRELKAAAVPFSMEWMGDGPEMESLQRQVKDAGLEKDVSIRGQLPYADVETAYKESDLFLFTGRIDRNGDRAGLPNAVAEAMAWGVAVFATNVGAVHEAIIHRQTGYLWEGEPDPASMIRILQHPAELAQWRINARNWVENEFAISSNLKTILEKFGQRASQ